MSPIIALEIFQLKVLIFFLFLHKYFLTYNICCGYSLEVPWQDVSNELPYYMFSWMNKKTRKYFSKDSSLLWLWCKMQTTKLFLNNSTQAHMTFKGNC